MTTTNDAPVTVEAVSDLIEMLTVGTATGAFDHTPEEIGLHVMENAPAILAALASAPAGDGVEALRSFAWPEVPIRDDVPDDAYFLRDALTDLTITVGQVRAVRAALARPRAAVGGGQ